ncbi:MAG TPA: HDIG domain-containing protein [Thermotogota bacterium]|nr:HDIG domain-containing protein [Thermotogota bacterium]HPJ89716.1 HDIG domain-containing protein [Thermotogota bacterium]HPR96939.1 HDIG domain-containing protein [Thermotogota bacterium]
MKMNRQEAWELLNEYTKKDNLIKHALAVEAAMRAYAKKFGEDEEAWAVVGLLHDFDYEKYPTEEEHPYKGAEILREKGVDENWIRAILGHAEYTGTPRETLMAKTLFAVDELSGMITAATLVRPSRKIEDLTVKSVRKKLKDKAFAASVSREDIQKGAEELNIDLAEHIQFVIDAMKEVSDELGL